MNNFQKVLVIVLLIGGLIMATMSFMDYRAEVNVEKEIVEIRRIINEAKK